MPESPNKKTVQDFLVGKSKYSQILFHHFVQSYQRIAPVTLYPSKTMIGIAHEGKKIAWITQVGKDFVHVVFPFPKPYPDNLCFQKIAQVPGNQQQFNHHFRMRDPNDVNEEVERFMKIAYLGE